MDTDHFFDIRPEFTPSSAVGHSFIHQLSDPSQVTLRMAWCSTKMNEVIDRADVEIYHEFNQSFSRYRFPFRVIGLRSSETKGSLIPGNLQILRFNAKRECGGCIGACYQQCLAGLQQLLV